LAVGGILSTPGRGAKGLLIWAVDLWHYVNGKALVNGLRLGEMEVSDMLDVIHYFYDESMNYSTLEQGKWADSRRERIFHDLYGVEYKYKSFADDNQTSDEFGSYDENEDIVAFNPSVKSETKSYIPPTKMEADSADPFGGVLDAPIA
jgi:hypothetical protein